MQLVGPHVTLWDTMRDKRVGAREVRERFGVEPAALVDIQALMGDSIDNIKGVPGVGEKTASALIQKFGCLKHLRESRPYRGVRHPRREEIAGRWLSIARRWSLQEDWCASRPTWSSKSSPMNSHGRASTRSWPPI